MSARRVVSLVPSLTELLAALGLDDEVVGLTRFCTRPDGWRDRKARVGGTKNVRVERVRALAPDLVVANREENEREAVEAIAAFAPVLVTDIATRADALAAVREIGAAVGRTAEADALAREVESAFAALPPFAPLRAAYLIWRDPWMTVGGDTFIHDVMAAAGLVNVFGDRTRYPAVTADEIAAARPDVLLLSSEPYPFDARHVAEASALAPGARVALADGEAFSWYGARMREAPAVLAALRAALDGAEAPGGLARVGTGR